MSKIATFEQLGFHVNGTSGGQSFGDCPFCHGKNKFYVNPETGQYDCKKSTCVASTGGNVFTFMTSWYFERNEMMSEPSMDDRWNELGNDRKLDVKYLRQSGLVWDPYTEAWYFPLFNEQSTIVSFRYYKYGNKVRALPGLPTYLYGLNHTIGNAKRVYLCEGEWDAIAMMGLLDDGAEDSVVVSVPGCTIFKEGWERFFNGREVVLCYDNDDEGRKAHERVGNKLAGQATTILEIKWPEQLPPKFDIRDWRSHNRTLSELHAFVVGFSFNPKAEVKKVAYGSRPPISTRTLTFDEVVTTYKKHLLMRPEMIDALRIVFSVVMSNQIPGDPLWVHFASPAGSGKTELLTSVSGCEEVHVESTITPASLVSGYITQDGSDPSLIPKLVGGTFVLKDFTEILAMGDGTKTEIYAILRGAYDGMVEKPFGNGIQRSYVGHFSMITGVTHAIFGERGASLGERFLIYHMMKDTVYDVHDIVMKAIEGAGKEESMKYELQNVARSFLEYKIAVDDIPVITYDYQLKLASLAYVVAMLRSVVEKSRDRERIEYRPQHEVPTRVAKQLAKCFRCLSLTYDTPECNDDAMRIISRMAMDTCIGFNLDIARALAEAPDGLSVNEIARATNIPHSTCQDHLTDMHLTQCLIRDHIPNPAGRGAPMIKFSLSIPMRKYWESAGLLDYFRNASDPTPARRVVRRARSSS